MLVVGEAAVVEVGHQRAGALVAALAGAVDQAGGEVARVHEGAEGVFKAFGRPGVGLLIDVLHRVGSLKRGLVDDHAVRRHAQRIHVVVAVRALAGRHDGSVVGVDVGDGLVRPQIVERKHLAGSRPVRHQALRAFHDDVRGGLGLDGCGDLRVAVGVVEVFNGHLDVGVHGVESGEHFVYLFRIAPIADRERPEGDVRLGQRGGHRQHEQQAQKQGGKFLHG